MIIKDEKRTLVPGDRIHCVDRDRNRFITVEIADIAYQDDYGKDGLECEFSDTDGIYRNWKQRFDGGFVLNRATAVPLSVRDNIRNYFGDYLSEYEVEYIVRASEHQADDYFYMVVARNKKNGTYTAWTSWNESTQSLNYGHYGIRDFESACQICKDRFRKVGKS